jgi:hypothetical protein
MVQTPFEVWIVGHELEPSSDPRIRAVTKADVAQDVTAELRKHFAGHPLNPDGAAVNRADNRLRGFRVRSQ